MHTSNATRTRIGVALLLPLWLLMTGISGAQTVPVHGLFETSFSGQTHANPYLDVTATVTFSGPATSRVVTAFWDGGTNWKVRFSPPSGGTWSYLVSAPADAVLNGQSGSFVADAGTVLAGGIQVMTGFPYHFQTETGDPFWFWGDTLWSGYSDNPGENLDFAAFQHYADVRASQGFNYVHTWATYHPSSTPGPYVTRSTQVLNPAYWQEVDRRVAYLNSKGITAGFMLAWAADGGRMDWADLPSDAARVQMARYVAARYGAYNVLFIVSGEWNESGPRARYDAIGQAIAATDPHDRLITIHATGSVEDWADAPWNGLGDYSQNYAQLHSRLLVARDHNKPVINSEYAYFMRDANGDGVVDKPNSGSTERFRLATWELLMAGGYVVTGFGSTYFGGIRDAGPFNVDHPINDPGEATLVITRDFFLATRWWELNPYDSGITGPGTHYALANPGSQYVVYGTGASGALTLAMNTVQEHTYRVRRYDLRTGTWTRLPDHSGFTSLVLTAPDNLDWAWYIDAIDGVNQSPGVSLGASTTRILPGGSVRFTPVSNDPDGTVVSHTWHIGGINSAGSGPPLVRDQTFATAGDVHVSVTVTDNNGASSTSAVVTITVATNRPPVFTSASATPNTVEANQPVTLTASATDMDGDGLSFDWLVDGNTQPDHTGANATHIFTQVGNHTIVARVTDGIDITVQALTVDVGADITAPAQPQNVEAR